MNRNTSNTSRHVSKNVVDLFALRALQNPMTAEVTCRKVVEPVGSDSMPGLWQVLRSDRVPVASNCDGITVVLIQSSRCS